MRILAARTREHRLPQERQTICFDPDDMHQFHRNPGTASEHSSEAPEKEVSMKRALFMLSLALVALFPSTPHAQQASGQFARMVVIKPKPGQAMAFTDGYKRHLVWHRDHKDPWTWHGWTFVLGNRIGSFMDGTFGHALENFDHAVDPRGDSADNQVNVVPYGDFLSHGVYERLESASYGAPLPDSTPYLALTTYFVNPGREAVFEEVLADTIKRLAHQRMSWYRLRLGGDFPQYVLMRPAQTFSAGSALPAVDVPPDLVQKIESELLRYQTEMSYVPR
jgi:hypothetical protein